MNNQKTYLFSLAVLVFLMGFLLSHWDGSHPVTKEIAWVFKQLPDVKTVEYLETLKKK
jgi:hypothetical protein